MFENLLPTLIIFTTFGSWKIRRKMQERKKSRRKIKYRLKFDKLFLFFISKSFYLF